jgi:hypothetical protein
VSDPAGGAVTVVVTRVVHPGREREFAAWADEVDRAAAGFAGHLGGVRLHDNQGLHHLVYRFDSERHLAALGLGNGISECDGVNVAGDQVRHQPEDQIIGR